MQQPPRKPNHTSRKPSINRTDDWVRARTLSVVAAFLIFGFGILTYQLYCLQLRDVEKYRIEAVQQQLNDTTIPALRGSIYSANGKLLAKSTTMWNIVADPAKCSANSDCLREAFSHIAVLLELEDNGEALLAKFLEYQGDEKRNRYMVIATGVDMETANAVVNYARSYYEPQPVGAEGNPDRVLSLRTEQTTERSYPFGSFMSQVLGFCKSDGSGAYGLEASYNDVLAGTPGRSLALINALGGELAESQAETHDPINGSDLHLTIDDNIQSILEQYLTKAVEDYNVQNRACGIVMNVNTGAIYGMATAKQFDPNDPYTIADEELNDLMQRALGPEGKPVDYTLGYTEVDLLESRLGLETRKDAEGKELIVSDAILSAEEYYQVQGLIREAQWRNKTVSEPYYPGSVFKLITASAGLDSGVMDSGQTFYCGGNYVMSEGTEWEHTYRCAEGATHGMLDLAGALNHSCNIYFVQAAQKMNTNVFYAYEQAFGLFETTGIDLPNENRWMSYYNEEGLAKYETALTSASFGQGQTFTPLQIATAVAAISNGGYLVTPHVVDYISDQNGNVVQQIGTTVKRQVISEEVSAQIRAMMSDIVASNDDGNYHGGAAAYVAGYDAGGKSGTAEIQDRRLRYDGDYHKAISFVEVLPISDPEILVYIMLDDPRWNNDFASVIVAPVVGNIVSEVAPYLGIEQDSNFDTEGSVLVHNCVGTTWTTAQVNLNKVGLSHKIIGPTGDIVYQYPYGGTKVPTGSTVYLYTTSDVDQMTAVPDVVGKTGSFAKQMLQAAGLNVEIIGDGESRVLEQDVEPNASKPMGYVVTITTE